MLMLALEQWILSVQMLHMVPLFSPPHHVLLSAVNTAVSPPLVKNE